MNIHIENPPKNKDFTAAKIKSRFYDNPKKVLTETAESVDNKTKVQLLEIEEGENFNAVSIKIYQFHE